MHCTFMAQIRRRKLLSIQCFLKCALCKIPDSQISERNMFYGIFLCQPLQGCPLTTYIFQQFNFKAPWWKQTEITLICLYVFFRAVINYFNNFTSTAKKLKKLQKLGKAALHSVYMMHSYYDLPLKRKVRKYEKVPDEIRVDLARVT